MKQAMQVDQELLLPAAGRLGRATNGSAARGRWLLLLTLDHQPAGLFFLNHPLYTGLHLRGQMQEMPDIALMDAGGSGRPLRWP